MDTLTRTLDSGSASRSGQAVPRLVLALEGARPKAEPESIPLREAHTVELGRAPERSVLRVDRAIRVQVPDSWMSTTHARLTCSDGRWQLEDLRSKNGTVVNGAVVTTTALRHGDVIVAGGTVFLFQIDEPLPDVALPPQLRTLNVAFAQALEPLPRVAATTVPVLLSGETGTGKEVVARCVHALSERRGEFVAVNCGALPDTLVEGELFGAKKGAFSGANEDRPGLVRAADGGTLFLDEIAELPLSSQAALLRVLQEEEVVPLGGTRPVKVSIRLIAATHQDLQTRVAEGRFRDDLYARLLGFQLALPALRQRREDVGLLVSRLLPDGDRALRLLPDAARALFTHDWPLNVRELQRALAAAAAVTPDDRIALDHFPEAVRGSLEHRAAEGRDEAAITTSRERLVALLEQHGGNVSAVARALGTSRSQVRRLASRFDVDLASYRA